MKTDMLWTRGKFKAGTINSLLTGCRMLNGNAWQVTLPVYAQHAAKDVACSIVALQAFLTK